jgi:hypothetical protein
VDAAGLALAWAFVACRALHSLIHLTAAGTVVLLAIWIRLVLAVVKQASSERRGLRRASRRSRRRAFR